MVVNKKYYRKIRKILKTYNSILVKCKTIPKISDKDIIFVESMDGMINTQLETRKPILYFQEDECVSFMLVDGAEIYIYIIKMRENLESAIEHIINNMENAKNTFVKEILSNLEKVLLTGNIDNGNVLLANELKYLGSVKEEEKVQVETIKNKTKEEEIAQTEELHLVPVRKSRKSRTPKRRKRSKIKDSLIKILIGDGNNYEEKAK